MNYVGVDLHKKTSYIYVLDQNGQKLFSKNISNSPEIVKRFLKAIPGPYTLAVEATYNWYYFIDIAEEYAKKVYLADSYELKAFAKRHKKTDRIDAKLIAKVLYKGFLPEVHIADKKTREFRELLRYRLSTVKARTRNISRLKMLLDKLGFDSTGNFTTYKRLNEIQIYALPSSYYKFLVDDYIDQIRHLTKRIHGIEEKIAYRVSEDKDILNLISIKGLGYFGASLVKTEIIDIARFKTFNKVCAYAGLAPRVYSSANKTIHGPLNNNRRKNLQWILLENVYHFINAYPAKKEKYLRIKQRKGHNTAKVVLARDMLKAIYIVLKENREFYHEK